MNIMIQTEILTISSIKIEKVNTERPVNGYTHFLRPSPVNLNNFRSC